MFQYLVIIIWLKYLMFCFPLLQASLLLSKISPAIVGESLEAKRFYDAVSCLMSYMVSTFDFFFTLNCCCWMSFLWNSQCELVKNVYFMENKTPWKGSNPLVSCLNIILYWTLKSNICFQQFLFDSIVLCICDLN